MIQDQIYYISDFSSNFLAYVHKTNCFLIKLVKTLTFASGKNCKHCFINKKQKIIIELQVLFSYNLVKDKRDAQAMGMFWCTNSATGGGNFKFN